jgi:hypothetical protein
MSRREQRLVVGFAFFAELILGYFLLIDPDLTRLSRLAKDREKAQAAISALEANTQAPPPTAAASVPPTLPVPKGEAFDLELQRYLDDQITASGCKPLAVALPTPAPQASPGPYRSVRVSARGPFPAMQKLVDGLGRPPYRLGLQTLDVRADGDDPKLLRLDADLFVEPKAP